MGIVAARTGAELTSGETTNVWSDYEGTMMLAPTNNLVPDPEFNFFDAADDALRYWNLQAAPTPTHWVVYVRDNNVQKRFSKQVSGSIPLTTDAFDIDDELVPGASPLDVSETVDIAAPAIPDATSVQVSTIVGIPAGWYILSFAWVLDEDWKIGKRITGAGRRSEPFQLAQGQGLQFEPPTELPAGVFGLVVYLSEPKATATEARESTVLYEQARYGVRDLPRPVKIVGPYEARSRSAGNATFVGDKAGLGPIEATSRATNVDFVQETTTNDAGETINVPITTGQVMLSYKVETAQGTSFSRDPSIPVTVQNNGRQMLAFRPKYLPATARGWIPEFVVNGVWHQILKNDGGFFAPGEYAYVYTSEPSNWPGSALTNTAESGGPSKEDTTGMKAPDDPPESPIILDLLTSGLTPGMHYIKTALMAGDEEGPVSDLVAVNVLPGHGLRIKKPRMVNKMENADTGEREVTEYNKPRGWVLKSNAQVIKNTVQHTDTSGSTTPNPIATTPLISLVGGGLNNLFSSLKTVQMNVATQDFNSGKVNIIAQVFNNLGTLIKTSVVQSLTSSSINRSSSDIPEGAEGEVSASTSNTSVRVQLGGSGVNNVDTSGGSFVRMQASYAGSSRVGGSSVTVRLGYVSVVNGGSVPSFIKKKKKKKKKRRDTPISNVPRVTPQPPVPPRPPQPPRQPPPPPPKPPTAPATEIVEQLEYEAPSGGYCHVVENPGDRPRRENYVTLDRNDFRDATYKDWIRFNAGGYSIQNFLTANQTSFETDVNTGMGGTATRIHSSLVSQLGTFSMGVKANANNTDQYVSFSSVSMPGGNDVWKWRARVYFPVPTRMYLPSIYLQEAGGSFRKFARAGEGFKDFEEGWHTLTGEGQKPADWLTATELVLRPAVKDAATTVDYDTNKTIYYDDVTAGLAYLATSNDVTTASGMISRFGLRLQKYADAVVKNFVQRTLAPRDSISVMGDLFLEDFSGRFEVFAIRNVDNTDVAALSIEDDGSLVMAYRNSILGWVSTTVATNIDDKQFLSLELSYDAKTKEVKAYMGPNEYSKTQVGSAIAGLNSTAQLKTVFAGFALNETAYPSRHTVHFGQIAVTDKPTVPNSDLTDGNYIEYFSPDGTPLNSLYGPTGLHVPIKPHLTYTVGVNTWYQDLMAGSELFNMRAKDKNGVVLRVYGSLVSGMSGDRERWERTTKQITIPRGAVTLEFFANNLGGGKLKIHGLQVEEGLVATPFNSSRARNGSFSVYLNNRQPGMKLFDPMIEISRIKRLRRIFVEGHDTDTTSYSSNFRTANSIAELAGKPYTNDYSKLSVDDNITEVHIQMASTIDGDTPEIHSVSLDVERPYAQLLREDGTEYPGGVLANGITTPSAPPNMEFLQMASGAIEGVQWGSERPKRISFNIESFRRSASEEIMYYPIHVLEADNKRYTVLFEAAPEFTPVGKRITYPDGSEYFQRESAEVTALILKTEDLG